jgi:O-antigen/teichoic acid export membrane protein
MKIERGKRGAMLLNIGAASVSRIGTSLLAFGLYWWLARRMPVAELGGFVFAMGLFNVLQVVPLLGRQQPFIREAATHPERLGELINEHWWFAWPIALAVSIGLLIYSRLVPQGTTAAVAGIIALALIPTAWIMVAECALLGRERMNIIAIANLIEAAWRLFGGMLVLFFGGQLFEVMSVFLAGRCLIALYYLMVARLPVPCWLTPPSFARWRLLCKSTPVYFMIIMLATLSARFDVLALSYLVSLPELGYYSAGAKIYEALMMLPSLVALVILPRLARIFTDNKPEFARLLSPIMRIIFAGGFGLAVIGAASAPWVVGLLYAPGFASAASVVKILLFAAVLATVDIVLSSAMIASNQQRQDLICLGIGLATFVLSMFVLVPLIGPVGAAVSLTLHTAVKVGYRIHWAGKVLMAQGLWPIFVRTTVAVIPAACVVWLLTGIAWPVAAMLSFITFFVSCMLLGVVKYADIARLGAITHSLQRRSSR